MKNADLERLMKSKLRFRSFHGGSHIGFAACMGSGVFHLPITVRISRGSGEASDGVVRSTARDLGLSPDGLTQASNCHLSRACVLICHLTQAIDVVLARRAYARDPIVHREATESILRVCESVGAMLDELAVEGGASARWTPRERQELARAKKMIGAEGWQPLAAAIATRLSEWIEHGCEGG
jgi:hypothetical protein